MTVLQIPRRDPKPSTDKRRRREALHHEDREIELEERAARIEAKRLLKRLAAPPREVWSRWIDVGTRGLTKPAVFDTEMLLRAVERGAWALVTGASTAEVIAPALGLLSLDLRMSLLDGAPSGSAISPVVSRILDALRGDPTAVAATVLSNEVIAAITAARALLRSGEDVVSPPLRPAPVGA